MRTTISLPDPVFENARQAALARGISLSELIHEALLSSLEAPRATVESKIVLPTVAGGFVHSNLDMDKISALITMDDEEAYGTSR